jgi:hypothetical protein
VGVLWEAWGKSQRNSWKNSQSLRSRQFRSYPTEGKAVGTWAKFLGSAVIGKNTEEHTRHRGKNATFGLSGAEFHVDRRLSIHVSSDE